MTTLRRVCVFCGSSPGERPGYLAAAHLLADALAERGLGLVYGGARVGLMGALADRLLEREGEAVGVIPESLVAREVAHAGLTRLEVVDTLHARKARMADLADAFVALPGGFGTLDELCEALTWRQLGIHRKPIGLLDVEGYWAPFLALADHAVREGFVPAPHRALIAADDDPGRLLDALAAAAEAPAAPPARGPEVR